MKQEFHNAKGVFMINKYKLAAFASLLGTGLAAISLPSTAMAQNTTKPQGWYKACSDQGESKICNVQYQVVASTGQVITSINLAEITGKIERRVFQITVPTGRLIPPGVELKVDGKKASAMPYSFCTPRVCAAEVKLDDNLVKVLKGGGELDITSVNFQGKPNPVKVSLNGFTSAYDGEPIKRDELAKRQKELQEELAKKAEETRKKLQEAQDAAKSE